MLEACLLSTKPNGLTAFPYLRSRCLDRNQRRRGLCDRCPPPTPGLVCCSCGTCESTPKMRWCSARALGQGLRRRRQREGPARGARRSWWRSLRTRLVKRLASWRWTARRFCRGAGTGLPPAMTHLPGRRRHWQRGGVRRRLVKLLLWDENMGRELMTELLAWHKGETRNSTTTNARV